MPNDPTFTLRGYSARMRDFVTLLWAGCLILVVLERFSSVTISLVRSGYANAALRDFACHTIAAVPEALFLIALWWVREALAAFARGELFGAPMTRMLERVGVVLACGAAMRILLVPGLCRLLGDGPPFWIAFDTAALVLGAIGLALRAIAGVLRHASVIQSELDEIF